MLEKEIGIDENNLLSCEASLCFNFFEEYCLFYYNLTKRMKYLSITPDSVATVFSASKYTEINSIKSLHLIASTYFIDRALVISYNDLITNIRILNLKRIAIYYILKQEQEQIDEQCEFFNNEILEVCYISYNDFTNIISSPDFNFDFNNKCCLFIFHGVSWSEIVMKFKQDIDVTVSGGSNVKRHLLSTLQTRLTSYMIVLFNLNCLEVFSHNRFNTLDKSKYLPYFDFSNKSKISLTMEGIKTTIPLNVNKNFTQDKHTNIKSMTVTNGKIGKTTFHTKTNSLSNPTINFNNNNTLYTSKKIFIADATSSYKTKCISTSTKRKDLDRKTFLSNCFRDLETLISSNAHGIELQNKIETYLFNSENHFNSVNKSENNPSLDFSSQTSKWVLTKYNLIVEHLDNMINKEIKINGRGKLTLIQQNLLYTKKVLGVLGSQRCANILITFFLDLVSKETNKGRLIQIEYFTFLGKKLVNLYTFSLYSKYCKKHSVNITLSEWKDLDVNNNHLYDSTILVAIAGNIVQFLTTTTINMIELTTEYGEDGKLHNIIKIESDARSIIIKDGKTKVFSVPTKLPMIVEPKNYKLVNGKIMLGGFINNDIFYADDLFIDKVGYKYTTKLKEDNDVIDLINGVSRIPYKINKEVLNFIQLYGVEKNIIMSINKDLNKFIHKPYIKMSNKLNKELRSLQSMIYLQTNILNIAELYSSLSKIYFPVRLDQRTRLYCNTEYFNYQSTDLSKGLLLFFNSGTIYKHDIDSINYLKSYGATLFDSALDKKSINYKVKWIDNNTDYILNFRSNDIINKSNHKACFLSFCFEYSRFIDFINDIDATSFITHLPIQLDASCNGYQHLSLLTRDKKVLKQLNLTPSTKDDDPDDLYNFMLIKIREYIKNRLNNNLFDDEEEKLSIIRLNKILLNRSIVKKALMTYSYNASIPQMVNYIKEMLHLHTSDEIKNLNSKKKKNSKDYEHSLQTSNSLFMERVAETKSVHDNKVIDNAKNESDTNDVDISDKVVYTVGDDNNYITSKDIYRFIKYFKIVLDDVFPRMKHLNSYIRAIVKICTKLNIAIPWTTPSGAIINQSYLNSKTLKLKPFAFIKSKYNFRTIIKNEFDSVKQLNATMPNLIHSLDASSIALLYKVFSECDGENIYTVHDCFAVTSNNVKLLIGILKGVYIKIYSENVYLSSLDKHIFNTILNIFGEDAFSCNYKFIHIWNNKTKKTEKITYPKIDDVLDINTNIIDLKHSEYIIK